MITVCLYGRFLCYVGVCIIRFVFDRYCVFRYRAYSRLIVKIEGDIEVCTWHIRCLQETKDDAERCCLELRLKYREVQMFCRTVTTGLNPEIEGLLQVARERAEAVEHVRVHAIQDLLVAEQQLNRLQGERSHLMHLRKQIPVPPAFMRK